MSTSIHWRTFLRGVRLFALVASRFDPDCHLKALSALINKRTFDWCTGTLVAAALGLIAAHSVMDEWKKAPDPLHHIHSLAGVRGWKHKDNATAKCWSFIEPDSGMGQVA